MGLHWIDWSILIGTLAFISVVAYSTKRHTQSVADFLAANRCAGKYVLGVADGIAGLGAISVVAYFEQHYKAGFSAVWWNTMVLPFTVIVALTGWIQYRYRQTRVLTLAQFLEIRYSRRFRVFAGLMAFFSGILNFGIFPAVGGRFFQYYCGLSPWMVSIGFTEIDLTYALIMVVLLAVSLAFTFMGGQIAVIVTDFFQGTLCNIAFCLIAGYLLFVRFDWSQMLEAFQAAPPDASLFNPARSGNTDNFNVSYFLIYMFGLFLNFMAWQGNQGYFVSAKTPHESKMGRVVASLRPMVQAMPIALLAVGAFTIMHHEDFAAEAGRVQEVLNTIDNPKIQSQQTVTVAIAQMLPVGLLGIFAAVMLAAFISTHDTYLHSWGSIFVQDVVLPIRQTIRKDDTPMSPRAHLLLLRVSIFAVAVFIFLFSLFFRQQQDVFMFFALTGTFFLGWAGWTMVGGLYWKHGNTEGAWTASIVGIVLSVAGWYATYFWGNCQAFLSSHFAGLWAWGLKACPELVGEKCPYSAQILYFWSMVATGIVYGVVSLLWNRRVFNMDRMLHRGNHAAAGDTASALPARGWAALRMTPEYRLDDKVLHVFSLLFIAVSVAVFLVITTMFAVFDVEFSDVFWGKLWWVYSLAMLAITALVTVWLAVGGAIDLKDLYRTLARAKRDAEDDGTVVAGQSLVDVRSNSGQTEKSTEGES